jgi:hypothetical protein
MRSDYEFEQELATLRVLLKRENYFSEDRRYVSTTHDDIKGLVILLEDWLRTERGYDDKDERREIRLAILSLITESTIRTTYDLTLYQCSCISYFLRHGPQEPDEELPETPGYDLTERAKWFLADLEDRTQGKNVYRERGNVSRQGLQRPIQRHVQPDLSDLFTSS